MGLTDFLRINLPYGIEMDEFQKWFAFNREYKPLGWDTQNFTNREDLPNSTKYSNMTESFLLKLGESRDIFRNTNGQIYRVMLYNDATNPNRGKIHWNNYAIKLEMLSKIEIEGQNSK